MSGLLARALEARSSPTAAPMSPRDVEFIECLLYMHIDTARRARMRMDRMAWSLDYAEIFQQREAAIEQAKKHLHTLRDAGVPLDKLLESMLTAEEVCS